MSKRRRGHEDHEEHENHERWLVSYADMVTLLFALFVILFAISQVDLAKLSKFRDGFNERTGGGSSPLPGGDGVLTGGAVGESAAPILPPDLAGIRREDPLVETQRAIEEKLVAAGLREAVQFRTEQRGLVISIVSDSVLFDLGSADLRAAGREVLRDLAPALRAVPNLLTVEGHTDDRPIRGRFASNWELSTARGTTVLRHLVEELGLPASRLSASGYADQRPLAPNVTPEGRARNRRVEIVVLGRQDGGAT